MRNAILKGNALEVLKQIPSETVQCVVTSPPYWRMRVYSGEQDVVWGGAPDCLHSWVDDGLGAKSCEKCGAYLCALGLEPILDCGSWVNGNPPCNKCYCCHLRSIFDEVRRVLKKDGVVWLNIGDCYAGSGSGGGDFLSREGGGYCQSYKREGWWLKPKDLCLVPYRVALALQASGWWVRADVVWAKRAYIEKEDNDVGCGLPHTADDRPIITHEYVFLLTKSSNYFYDWLGFAPKAKYVEMPDDLGDGSECIPRKRLCSVWQLNPMPFSEAHFATMPVKLAILCIKLSTSDAGECPVCKRNYKRVIERLGWVDVRAWSRKTGRKIRMRPESPTSTLKTKQVNVYTSRGFKPSCGCGAPPVPNIVLDPFAGSGTTLVAAKILGRDYLGIEISDEYIDIASRRLSKVVEDGQLGLFPESIVDETGKPDMD